MQRTIDIDKLKLIIAEETSKAGVLLIPEAADTSDPTARANVVSVASKLLSSIRTFQEKATESMLSHVASHLDEIAGVLDDMTRKPDAYVDKATRVTKVVTLKPSTDESL